MRSEKRAIKAVKRPKGESQNQLHELMALVQKKAGLVS